jgi:hypothetical protein
LGESVTFECGVEAADVSGVDVWWRKDSLNLTVGENTTNLNRKYDIQVRYFPYLSRELGETQCC